jgi:ubiquinone/menaquinone biosynthesis C-methylase UbiE
MITIDLKRLRLLHGSRILDIGCGSGRHSAAACDHSRSLVVGADAKAADLSAARGRANYHARVRQGSGGTFCPAAADITCLPFADHTFDLLICSEVLEHIPDHRQAVSEMVRVLKPGAQLALSVPRRLPEALCWALSRGYRHAPGGHVRIYRFSDLVAMLASHGLRHHQTHYAHSLHTPYWWLKCLLGLERDRLWPVRLYHRWLTWEMFHKPRLVRTLERCLDPLLGKSVVLYFTKTADSPHE